MAEAPRGHRGLQGGPSRGKGVWQSFLQSGLGRQTQEYFWKGQGVHGFTHYEDFMDFRHFRNDIVNGSHAQASRFLPKSSRNLQLVLTQSSQIAQ